MRYLYICILANLLATAMDAPQGKLLPNPTLIKTILLAQPATARFTRDGKKLLIGSQVQEGSQYTSKILVYDTSNYDQPIVQFPYPYDTYAIDTDPANPDNACIANFPVAAQIRNITNGNIVATLPEETGVVQTMEYSNDGKQLLFATASGTFLVDVATAKMSTMLMAGSMRAARFKPTDNNLIAYVAQPQEQENGTYTIYLQDVRAKDLAWKTDSEIPVFGLAFNSKGDHLVANDLWNFGLYDTATGKLKKYLSINGKPEKHFKPIPKNKGLTYADSGKFRGDIFFGSTDSAQMVIFDISNGKNTHLSEQTGNSSDVWQLDISPDGKMLVAPQSCGMVQFWDISEITQEKSKPITSNNWNCQLT